MTHVCILSSVHQALDNRIFYREARSLQRAGYEVTLIAVHPRDEVKNDVQIIGLPRVPRWQRPRLWWTLLHRALATRADVYHFHDPELLLVTPWLRLLSGKPTIYDVHEAHADFIQVKEYMPTRLRSPLASVFRRVEPWLARLQSALVFADGQIAIPFERVSCPQTTLYNFPASSFVKNAAAATREIGAQEPIVLYLGGLKKIRGTAVMIEAFQTIVREMPSARLLLVGPFSPPDLEQEVREDIARRGLQDAVDVVGSVPFEQVGEYLTRASVGWLAWQPVLKNKKNIPTKLFEYMAYALPIVSSDLPSTRPFIHDGREGYLATADDPAAHAEAILRLLRDPQAARAMGQRGQELVQTQYSWDAMEERLLALYEAVLQGLTGSAT